MKLVAALHGAHPGPVLRAPALRTALAAGGATALQVNVDDAAVAPALRFGPGTPITAVVSVWTEDPAAALHVLHEVDESTDAWLVEELSPIPPPVVPDGERADALANLAFLRRPAAMTPEAPFCMAISTWPRKVAWLTPAESTAQGTSPAILVMLAQACGVPG